MNGALREKKKIEFAKYTQTYKSKCFISIIELNVDTKTTHVFQK